MNLKLIKNYIYKMVNIRNISILIVIITVSIIYLKYYKDQKEITQIIPKYKEDNRDNKNKLRIVQYNVLTLYENIKIIKNNFKNSNFKTKNDLNIHLNQITNEIENINPDIMNLCEIEGKNILSKMTKKLNNNKITRLESTNNYNEYESYFIKNKLNTTSSPMYIGLITKITPNIFYTIDNKEILYPIEKSKCGFIAEPLNSINLRKHYISEFTINNKNIAIIGLHLISQFAQDKNNLLRVCLRNEAIALGLQPIIYNYIQKKHEIIILGDFNEEDPDIELLDIIKPKTNLFEILKGEAGPYKNKYRLINVANYIELENRDTMRDINYNKILDTFLISEGLKKNIEKVSIHHRINEMNNEINSIYTSDHFPIILDLKF